MKKVNVVVFDVGFGDAIYVKIREKEGEDIKERSFLIDCGKAGGISKKASYLRKHGVDYIILTHKHSDHISGLKTLIDGYKIKVKGIIMRGDDWDGVNSRCFSEVLSMMDENKVTFYRLFDAKAQDVLRRDFKILYPSRLLKDDSYVYKVYDNQNKNSIVLSLEDDDEIFFFMADATMSEEKIILANNNNFIKDKLKYVKIGHHGSDTSTGIAFVEALGDENDRRGVVSCNGTTNPPPHVRYLERVWRSELIYTERGNIKGDIEIDDNGMRKLERETDN